MHDSENAIPEEGGIVASLDMCYFHIPIQFKMPTVYHVRKFFDVMEMLENEKVLVHCTVNARVSAFMYKYLTLKMGLTPEQSTSPLLQQWLPNMDDNWKSVMNLRISDIEL